MLINNLYTKYVKAPKDIEEGIGEIDLEIMLVNSLKINAAKIQEIIDGFLINKPYINIFCLTETKVDCVNFIPVGLITFDKQRTSKPETLKGGGLMIGYIENERIKLEKIETKSEYILIVEGTIYNEKIKIILTYFNCCKLRVGRRYLENREMQKEVEEHMLVEDDVNLVVLGDMNARMGILEPERETDANGQMIEEWIYDKDMVHLNRSSKCTGTYIW